MSRSGRWARYRRTSRIALGGAILGGIALAVGLFVAVPIADRSSSDDSPSSKAAILLVFCGLVAIILSAMLYAGAALWRLGRGRLAPRRRQPARPGTGPGRVLGWVHDT